MKNKKKNVTTIGKSGLVMTYDERLKDIRKHVVPAAKYVELNKMVANMTLPNV
jgi:hypothetical protein